MKLTIVTPERVVLEEDNINAVYAEAVDGEVGILPKHVPLVTPLKVGVLRYEKAGQKSPVAIMGGLLHTDGSAVSILCDAAERGDELDALRAQEAKNRAESRLAKKDAEVDTDRARQALIRATTRLKAGKASF